MRHDAIVLASASARRSQLLTQIGIRHRTHAPDIDESALPRERPADYVGRLAAGKLRAVVDSLQGRPACPVRAADTTVVLDGEIYGKPEDEAHGVAMLSALGGRRHEVLTALALWLDGSVRQALSSSYVTFRAIEADECRRYWA